MMRSLLFRTKKVDTLESIIYPDLVELEDDCTIAQYLAELNEEPKPKNTAAETSDEVVEVIMET